ncbi:hypothetical protein RvY_04879 [Ramazzottius varieornatus]|uniref:Uncharacterized protein n=1 Tax=Ramazzottius varieornatus TaxID=947166 RepID=A0A1D1V2A2_RAMVA|nr:hypothetical protein RvY_04879 [Ramazzottius varieornatus]
MTDFMLSSLILPLVNVSGAVSTKLATKTPDTKDHKYSSSEGQHSSENSLDSTPLYHLCRPLIWLMRLGGMFL